MSDERSQFARKIDERSFKQSRRGYDKTEVKSYLEDLEQAFRELEGHSRRLSQKVAELEQELTKARATEKVSVDNAMMAVFDAKDRILERARRKASDIEEDARLEAGRIREAAIADAGASGASGEIAAARAQADEIIAGARREADRLREEVAVAANDGLEADLADMGERLRRAHDENAAVRGELDEARKRIVQLEHSASEDDSEEKKQKFAELEELVRTTRVDADRLQAELAQAQGEREAATQQAAETENARSQLQASLEATTAELEGARAAAAGAVDQAEFEALQAQLAAAQARVTELSDADRLHQEADALRAEAEEGLAAANSRASEFESRASEAETRLSAAENRANEAETRASEAESRLSEMEAKAAGAETIASEAESTVTAAESRLSAAEARAAEAETKLSAAAEKVSAAEARATEAEAAAATAKADLEAAQAEQTAVDDATATDVERAEFAGSMVAFEARATGALAQAENLALIAETTRAKGEVPSESAGATPDSVTHAEAEDIIAEAREEAEAIKAEAEEEAEHRAAKVIARAREEADQVRETVATLTAQADDARSAALRSKLEAEDLAEAQKAMSEARDRIIATAEGRAEEITQDAERIAANLRAEAETALQEAHAEAERIVAAAEEARAKELAAPPVEPDAKPATIAEPDPDLVGSTEPVSPEPQPAESGDELAALLAEAEQDLVANDKLRQERERLDAQEAELAAHRAEAILLAATRDGGAAADGATDTTGAEVESGTQELQVQEAQASAPPEPLLGEEPADSPDGDADLTAALDAPPPHIEFNDILDEQDATGADDALEYEDDADEEDPADLLTALLDEVAPGVLDDSDTTLESDPAELEAAPAAPQEMVEDLSEGTRPRVAWPSPVDLEEEPEEEADDAERQSRYRSRSAQLPRLGRQAESNMTTMANLRKKSRGIDED